MRTYKIHHIDSFTKTLFGGNPTVIVLNADSLSEEEMKKIACEMHLSETGFILSSENADFRLRFFTLAGKEIKFCGHATVGALCAVAKERLFGCVNERNFLSIETCVGILNVEINLIDPDQPKFLFDAPKIDLVPVSYSLEDVLRGLVIDEELIDVSKPLMLEKTTNYLYLTARNLESLGNIIIDIPKAIKFSSKNNIVMICVLSTETFEKANDVHARGFAPLVGVPEDPFTGSMQGGLAAYALKFGMIPANQKWIGVEQGHFMGRPGAVKLEITQAEPIQVRLHSDAVHVFASKIKLP